MKRYRLPRTWRGWRNLWWLALGRCPFCRGKLVRDWWLYDDGETAYCPQHGFAILPNGFRMALQWNARAAAQKEVRT